MKEPPLAAELGCAGLVAVVVVMLTAFGAVTLGRIGDLRTLRYAWTWTGLFLAGGFGPAILLATIGRRSRRLTIALTLWMLVALLLSFGLAIQSSGGV